MILKLNETEVAVLLLHMTITRKNVRNGFKRNYGSNRGKEVLNSYDEVLKSLETFIESDKDTGEVHFNVREIRMIKSFLSFYTNKLQNTLKAAGDITEEDQKQIYCLMSIEKRADHLLESVTVV